MDIQDTNISIGLEVRKTANDAIISKLSAAQLGYFKDDFITFFAHPALPNKSKRDATIFVPSAYTQVPNLPTHTPDNRLLKPHSAPPAYDPALPSISDSVSPINFSARRSPLINRGYYSRVAGLDKMIKEFLIVSKKIGLGSQIVSLGAGFDTTYWRMKFHHGLKADKYFEIDFDSSVAQKLMIIDHCPSLQRVLKMDNSDKVDGCGVVNGKVINEENIDSKSQKSINNDDIQLSKENGDNINVYRNYDDYGIVGGDLRDVEGLKHALSRLNIDFNKPTFFISECVLVYMPPYDSTRVINWAASNLFTGPVMFACYEQIHPDDPFGRTMMEHLANRGCALLGLLKYPTLCAQKERYLTNNWDKYTGWTMNDVYANYIDKKTARMAERIEIFDEFEEWHLIQGHYAINMAMREGLTQEWKNHRNNVYKTQNPEDSENNSDKNTEMSLYIPDTEINWFDQVGFINKYPRRH